MHPRRHHHARQGRLGEHARSGADYRSDRCSGFDLLPAKTSRTGNTAVHHPNRCVHLFGKQYLIMHGFADRRMYRKPAPAGYFLQEVVVTMFVLGIIAAVAIPKYTASLNRYRAQVACQRLAQDIELARRHARFTSQNVTFFVSFNKNFYSIAPLDSPLRPSNTHQVVLSEALLCPVISGLISPQSRSTQSDLTITFNRYGFPDAAASIGIGCVDASGIVQLSQEGQVSRQ